MQQFTDQLNNINNDTTTIITNNDTHNEPNLLRALSPLTIDLSACFLYERPHAPLPFPPSPRAHDDAPAGSPCRKRCRTLDEEEVCYIIFNLFFLFFISFSYLFDLFIYFLSSQTYQQLSNNLKSGCLRVPRFTKRHCIYQDNKGEIHTPKIKKVKHYTPYEDIKKRIRQVAQLDMACQSLFDEMKATC